MSGERLLRGALVVLGGAAMLRGAYLILFGLPPRVWLPIAIWLAVGSVVHDLVIAPLSLVLGRALGRRWGPRPVGNALRGAWLGLGTVLLVGLPLLVGAGRRANPTVIPGRPGVNLLLSLVLVIVGAVGMIAVNRVRRQRPVPPPTGAAPAARP